MTHRPNGGKNEKCPLEFQRAFLFMHVAEATAKPKALRAPEGNPPLRAHLPPPNGRLSPRETHVLRLISRGASNKDATKELALGPSTVRRKLDCSTRAAATLKASSMRVL
jgi:DNA-binding NarL/FixJ family response regulator